MERKSLAGGKKRRRIRSCHECRRRKVQCDQAVPACGRCVEADKAAQCQYLDDFAEVTVQTPHESAEEVSDTVALSSPLAPDSYAQLLLRLQQQERRTAELQASLASLRAEAARPSDASKIQLPAATPHVDDDNGGEVAEGPSDQGTVLLKGGSFKTRFFGDTHPESLISHIPSFGTLSKEIVSSHPVLVKLRQDLRATGSSASNGSLNQLPVTEVGLPAMLPARADTDELVHLYFDTYDRIYHVIHTPTFWQEYDEMWSDLQSARPHFVALVLAILAVSWCLRQKETWTYAAKGSTARLKAVIMIQTCEDWHKSQSVKKATVTDFQLHFLLNLARLVNGAKSKRSWTDAGTAVRHCMAAGLHKNPKWLIKPTSALDKEMRKRLWYATVEFELQASFQRGMPAQTWLEYSDCEAPTNIMDSECTSNAKDTPTAQPIETFTRASYLAAAATTSELRWKLNSMLNKTQKSLTSAEIRDFTDRIEKCSKAIPQWTEEAATAPRALLILNLRQYLLVLHFQQLRKTAPSVDWDFSRTTIMDAAVSIVDTHKMLVDRGCYTLQLLCQDQMRTALTVCYAVDVSATPPNRPSAAIAEQYAQYVADEVVEIVRSKVDRLGAGQQQLWTALVARTLIQIKREPTAKLEYIREAVHAMASLYYKMLACQIPQSNAAPPDSQPLPLWSADEPLHRVMQHRLDGLDFDGWPTPDLDDVADWTFDEWTFASSALDT